MPWEMETGDPAEEIQRLRRTCKVVRHMEEILAHRGQLRELVEARVFRSWVHVDDRDTRLGRRTVRMELIFQGEIKFRIF